MPTRSAPAGLLADEVGEESLDVADALSDDESDSDDEFEEPPERPSIQSTKTEGQRAIVRRQALPSGPVGDEGSLFAVMKKNIGKVWVPLTFRPAKRLILILGSIVHCITGQLQ